MSAAKDRADIDQSFTTTATHAAACFQRLTAGSYTGRGGDPAERSEMAPVWLMHPEGTSCGRLEDTRRAKRLIADDGSEMGSAHLSGFAFADHRAGVALIREALRRAALLGFPALFVAVAAPHAEEIRAELAGIETVAAPATVYGAMLDPFPLWNINTSEI
jgi:hypothetical protein